MLVYSLQTTVCKKSSRPPSLQHPHDAKPRTFNKSKVTQFSTWLHKVKDLLIQNRFLFVEINLLTIFFFWKNTFLKNSETALLKKVLETIMHRPRWGGFILIIQRVKTCRLLSR